MDRFGKGARRSVLATLGAASAGLSLTAAASVALAQTAPPAPPSTEQPAAAPLPEIVVTSPSPVRKKPKKSAARAGQSSSPSAAASAPATPQPTPPPQTTVETGTLDDAPFAPVAVTPDEQLLADTGATLTDTLQSQPGISGSTFAPGANRPIIRGLDNYRVRVQENGIGSHDVSALSEDHAVPIDPFAAEHVEVVRGPATLRYGSQAIGGVVSVENGRIPTIIPPRGFTAETMGGFSSGDDGRDGTFRATAGAGVFAVHSDGFKRQAEDYDTPQGRQLNSFVDSEGGSFGGSLIGRDGFVGVSVSRFESIYGIPGEEADHGAPRIDMVQDKVNAKGEWRVNGSAIEAVRFWFGASDYAHNEVVREDGANFVGSRFTNEEQEGRVELQHVPVRMAGLGELSGAAGVQWGHRDMRGQSFEGDSLLEPAETDTIAAFMFEELRVSSKLRLQAAGRIEHVEVSGTGIKAPLSESPILASEDRDFNPFGTSLGALYELHGGVIARLTGQYVERAPDAAELFSKGVHEATGTFEIGNPDLDIESARTVEFGLMRNHGRFRFDASAYYTRFNDFIYKQLTGVTCGETLESCGDEDELDQLVFAQRDAAFYGAELAAQYDVARIWRGQWGVDGQYDFVRAQFHGGENVPRIPPHRIGAGVFYRDGNWFARLGMLHAFDQDKIGLNETDTEGYTLVSAEIRYTTKLETTSSAMTEMTIGLKGENLADDEVRNHASFKKDEVLQPGASVRLFGSVKLN